MADLDPFGWTDRVDAWTVAASSGNLPTGDATGRDAVTADDLRHLRNRLDHLEDPQQLIAIAHTLLDEVERLRAHAFSGAGG
jgi:hypothetical protein